MTNKIEIIEADFLDDLKIRDLMLEALKNDPYAFSVDYEEYAFNSPEWWKSYLMGFLYKINSFLLLAKLNDKCIGMIGVIFEKRNRRAHLCSIVWFYVSNNNRETGVGNMLMSTLLSKISERKEIVKISLTMNQPQKKALNLYKKFGFKIVGTLEKEMKINGEFINEYILEKQLL